MPLISDVVTIAAPGTGAAIPTNGVTINAYKATRLGGPPSLNTAPPGGAVDGTAVSGPTHGGVGAWRITVPTDEDYYCLAPAYGAWFGPYASVENADLVHLAGAETITGGKTFSGPLSVKTLSAIRFADQFPGASVAAQIQAANDDLAGAAGFVIIPSTMGAGFASSPGANTEFLDLRAGFGLSKGSGAVVQLPADVASRALDSTVLHNNATAESKSGSLTVPVWDKGGAVVFAKSYGVLWDGVTDDIVNLQAALNAAAGGTLMLPAGVGIVGGQLLMPGNTIIEGQGKEETFIRAKAGTVFQYIIGGNNLTGCEVRKLTLDVNRTNRPGLAALLGGGCLLLTNTTDCLVEDVHGTNAIGAGATTVAAFQYGQAATRARFNRCLFTNPGAVHPNNVDAFYNTGTAALTSECVAFNWTDTAFVLEQASQSGIVNCVGISGSAVAAITQFNGYNGADNYIDGLIGFDWDASVTGAIDIGNAGGGGSLNNTHLANIILDQVAGTGPAINVQKVGTGTLSGLTLENFRVKGSTTQGILLNYGTDFLINGADISGCPVCVQVETGASDVLVAESKLYPTTNQGVRATNATNVVVQGGVIDGGGVATQGVYYFGTCPGARVTLTDIRNVTVAQVGSDAGTTPYVVAPFVSSTGGFQFGKNADVSIYRNAVGGLQTDSLMTCSAGLSTGAHIAATGTTPTVAAGAQNGTTPPAPTATGNDTRMTISCGSGTTPAAGAQIVVTFATAYAVAPVVTLTPANAATAALQPYVSSVTTAGYTLSTGIAPAASQAAGTYSASATVIG